MHPIAAGMLMFGNEYDIVRHFPKYFLDYREKMDSAIRWTDRLQSSSGSGLANCLINIGERAGSGVSEHFKCME